MIYPKNTKVTLLFDDGCVYALTKDFNARVDEKLELTEVGKAITEIALPAYWVKEFWLQ